MDLDGACAPIEGPSDDLLALDEALAKFAVEDPVKADQVKLRYFAGLTIEQAAVHENETNLTKRRINAWTGSRLQRKSPCPSR